MKNNSEHPASGALRKIFQEKGYYIVLFLCICAVGITGYLFVSNTVSEKNSLSEETMSIATEAIVPEPQTQPPSVPQPRPQAQQTPAEPQQTQSSPQPAPAAAPASIRVWPVSGPAQMPYSVDALRYNETMHDWRTHDGIDLEARAGAPVKASCAGTVTAVYDDDYLGTTVVISHTGGYTTQYSNLAVMPTVRAGDHVEAGDIIGSVGSTALLELGQTPHLHFAVACGQEPVDPADFIG